MSPQYGELRPTSGWDLFVSLRHPCKFQRVSRLGSVTARQSSSGCQRNFAALNRGCHLCSAGRPSRWALAHMLVYTKIMWLNFCIYCYCDICHLLYCVPTFCNCSSTCNHCGSSQHIQHTSIQPFPLSYFHKPTLSPSSSSSSQPLYASHICTGQKHLILEVNWEFSTTQHNHRQITT